MNVLVLGGYGATGAHIVALLRARGHSAIAAGRNSARADLVINLADTDYGPLLEALADVDVVINAAGTEDPAMIASVTAHGVAFVDITATSGYVAALDQLNPAAPVLVDVGLAPGLTNLLTAAVHQQAPGPIDIAVLVRAAEQHGAAGVDWIYRLLGQRFRDPATGGWVRNYTQPVHFDLPGHGRRRLYRADFSDQHTLTRDLRTPVRTYLGLDSRAATTTLALMTFLPGAAHAPRNLHFRGGEHWIVLARASDGTTRWATGHLQSHATATIAVAAAHIAAEDGIPAGVYHLHDVMTLADLPDNSGIEMHPTTHADASAPQLTVANKPLTPPDRPHGPLESAAAATTLRGGPQRR
jgi:hypothetical protein